MAKVFVKSRFNFAMLPSVCHVNDKPADHHGFKRSMKRFAAIDVGSNALRIRVADAALGPRLPGDSRGGWTPVGRRRVAVRLGHDVFLRRRIGQDTWNRASAALQAFRRIMDSARVDRYRAVATGALCEAANGSAMVSWIEQTAGIQLEPIDGTEEATLMTSAVMRRLEMKERRAVLAHLGGGSVELTLIEDGAVRARWTLPIGTVRLLKNPALTCDGSFDIEACALLDAHVDGVLRPILDSIPKPVSQLIATGGNARALALLCPARTSGVRVVDVRKMRELFLRIAQLPATARCFVTSLRPDRADVIVPAADVLYHVARRLRIGTIVTPDVGLKEGVLDALVADCLGHDDHDRGYRASLAVVGENRYPKSCGPWDGLPTVPMLG